MVAATTPSSMDSVLSKLNEQMYERNAELANFCVESVTQKKVHVTNILHDIVEPVIDEKTAQTIQDELVIQTSIVYPIIFAGEILGVLVLGMDKHVGFLSKAENETLKEL